MDWRKCLRSYYHEAVTLQTQARSYLRRTRTMLEGAVAITSAPDEAASRACSTMTAERQANSMLLFTYLSSEVRVSVYA